MTWMVWTVAGLFCVVLAALIFLMLSAATRVDLEDIEEFEEDDDDGEPVAEYVGRMPPFPIRRIGLSGEHDRYPIGDGFRRMFLDHCEMCWKLPAREPGATR